MKLKTFFIILLLFVLVITLYSWQMYPLDIFGFTHYSCNWVDSQNNVNFYSGGYGKSFYCGVIYPYNGYEHLGFNEINIVSKRRVQISGKNVNIPTGNNIVIMSPHKSFIFINLPDKYFIMDKEGHVQGLNINELKKGGIWESKIEPDLNKGKKVNSVKFTIINSENNFT